MMSELDTPRFRAWLERAWSEVSQSRAQLNAENLYPVADSDTGSNLEATLEAAVTAMRAEDSQELGDVADAAARGALGGAQGNSGVILSQIFRGFADGIREGLPQAFARAHEAAQKAVTHPKEGTILSAARAARDAVALRAGEMGRDGAVALDAWRAARASTLDSANNPPHQDAMGTIDAGAHGVELIYGALASMLDPELVISQIPSSANVKERAHASNDNHATDGEFEVMFSMEDLDEKEISRLQRELTNLGESLLVVGDSQLCKVHIHTNFPGEIIEISTHFGKAFEIKITHLASALGIDEKSSETGARKLITVANGPGLSELMRESGVGVIDAFNSRRVLAQEWVAATENAREVILIPIDQQSLKSAQEAIVAIRRGGVRVAVLSSRSPLQALSAISTHNEEADYDDEIVEMATAARQTRSATIALAPRDMNTAIGDVQAGDVLALVDGVAVVTGTDLIKVSIECVDRMLNMPSSVGELVTLVLGESAPKELAERVQSHLVKNHSHVEVTTYIGGQAWYPLLIGVE
jgi:DAK2 domain fusion protein YloV